MTILRTSNPQTQVPSTEVQSFAESRRLDPDQPRPETQDKEVAHEKPKKAPKQRPNKRSHKPRSGGVYHNAIIPV